MNRKILGVLAVALTMGAWMLADGHTWAQSQQQAHTARFQSVDEKSQGSIKQAELEYAKALLQVAQADLAKAREANSSVPDTIPNSVVRSLEYDAAEAAGRVKAMSGGNDHDGEGVFVGLAKQSLEFAEQNLKQARDANARAAGAVSAAEVQRRQADVDVARARLQMATLLNNASPTDMMEWQLLQLMAEVHDLRQQVRILQNRN